MILDNNLLAYEYYKDRFTPKEIYPSGEKEETSLIDKYTQGQKALPILILDDDIINKEGYGLKKGFYNIIPDKYLDFLLIYQQGKLKAKVPVLHTKVIATTNPVQEKPKKMSVAKYKKQQEKEYRKYFKGENPALVEYQEAHIEYDREKQAYIIFYFSNSVELTGMIKVE